MGSPSKPSTSTVPPPPKRPDPYENSQPPNRDAEFANIQPIFCDYQKNDGAKREIEANKEMIKEEFREIMEEYLGYVDDEWREEVDEFLSRPSSISFHRESLPQIQQFRCRFPNQSLPREGAYRNPGSAIRHMKPDRWKQEMACRRVEIGDIHPYMNYWICVEQSIRSKDQLRLTHLPYLDNDEYDPDFFSDLHRIFYDGIHGTAGYLCHSNDWLLYKLFRKILPNYSGNPDALYYAIYRLWPNRSQRELSSVFPSLCDQLGPADLDYKRLEPWKEDHHRHHDAHDDPIEGYKCYACMMDGMCPHHGFSIRYEPEFLNGNVVIVKMPLPDPLDLESERCSKHCWKNINMNSLNIVLNVTEEEKNKGFAKIVLDKLEIAQIKEAEKSIQATVFLFNHEKDFCEIAKMAIDPNEDDPIGPTTCQEMYHFIIGLHTQLTQRQLHVLLPPSQSDLKDRVQRYRKYQADRAKKKSTQKEREWREKAEKEGLDLEKLMEEQKNKGRDDIKVKIAIVDDITSCRHVGPCGDSNDDCACKENGQCTYLCKCDVNCPQRFPGCNCGPGMCFTKQCQCWFGSWECNPLTCHKCNCGDLDELEDPEKRCKNIGMNRLNPKRVKVAPSAIAGNGLFLLESVEKDEFIMEYVGERITDDEAERRGAIYDKLKCSYIFNVSTGGAIDSYHLGNLSRFANHDPKNPSVYTRFITNASESRIAFYAKRHMEAGDELTFDYSYSQEHTKTIGNRIHKGKTITARVPGSDSNDQPSTSGGPPPRRGGKVGRSVAKKEVSKRGRPSEDSTKGPAAKRKRTESINS